MNTVGQQLKNIRLNREMDIHWLAAMSGLHPDTIAAIEEDAIDVPISILAKISVALNCSFLIGDVSI